MFYPFICPVVRSVYPIVMMYNNMAAAAMAPWVQNQQRLQKRRQAVKVVKPYTPPKKVEKKVEEKPKHKLGSLKTFVMKKGK